MLPISLQDESVAKENVALTALAGCHRVHLIDELIAEDTVWIAQ